MHLLKGPGAPVRCFRTFAHSAIFLPLGGSVNDPPGRLACSSAESHRGVSSDRSRSRAAGVSRWRGGRAAADHRRGPAADRPAGHDDRAVLVAVERFWRIALPGSFYHGGCLHPPPPDGDRAEPGGWLVQRAETGTQLESITVTVQSPPWPSNCGAGRPDRWATIARYR